MSRGCTSCFNFIGQLFQDCWSWFWDPDPYCVALFNFRPQELQDILDTRYNSRYPNDEMAEAEIFTRFLNYDPTHRDWSEAQIKNMQAIANRRRPRIAALLCVAAALSDRQDIIEIAHSEEYAERLPRLRQLIIDMVAEHNRREEIIPILSETVPSYANAFTQQDEDATKQNAGGAGADEPATIDTHLPGVPLPV